MATGKKTGGRRRGTPNKATATRERQLAAGGAMPLDVMLTTMRTFWGEAVDHTGKVINTGKALQANILAKDAAPYCHPRLANIDARLAAELNAKVTQSPVIDASRLSPQQRAAWRDLLLSAMATAGEGDEEDEGPSEA